MSNNKIMSTGLSYPKVKRHHGWAVFLFIVGHFFPPLAVAARFGMGSDFWICLLLTVCGWIPGVIYNFWCQNIRNNKTLKRTPKWAIKYGLVDTSTIERHKKRSQWSNRYAQENSARLQYDEDGNPVDYQESDPNQKAIRGDRLQDIQEDNIEYYNPPTSSNLNLGKTRSNGRYYSPDDGIELSTKSSSGINKLFRSDQAQKSQSRGKVNSDFIVSPEERRSNVQSSSPASKSRYYTSENDDRRVNSRADGRTGNLKPERSSRGETVEQEESTEDFRF